MADMEYDVVIPARNESRNIGRVVGAFRAQAPTPRVIVIDNASEDSTGREAAEFGAEVVEEARVGKGYAIYKGLQVASRRVVFFCDGDIENLEAGWARFIVQTLLDEGRRFCRGAPSRLPEDQPVTELVAKPLLSLLFPLLNCGQQPLGGIFAIEREFGSSLVLPCDWGVDVGLTLAVAHRWGEVREVDLPPIVHRKKKLGEYTTMSTDVARTILSFSRQQSALTVQD